MRLGTLTLSATLSAFLLSGCSFINGKQSQHKNPYAKHNSAQYGQYGAQNCQIATPRMPIPRGCRPEQVTIGVAPQGQGYGAPGYGAPNYATNGFPQQPQFGQPQYADGNYGAAVGQSAALAYHTPGSKKRKPRLRGSVSIGADPSISGTLLDFGERDDLNVAEGYNPQLFNVSSTEGTPADGTVTTRIYTANDSINNISAAQIFDPNRFESSDASDVLFEDAWSVPINIKGGLEYILNDRTTIFANGGYTSADGQTRSVATVDATIYEDTTSQTFEASLPVGAPTRSVAFVPNQRIASFSQNFSDLEQYDLEVGARHYFNPLVKSQGYRTVTPFVGASVGISHVNAVDVTTTQTQAFYDRAFDGETEDLTFDIPTAANSTRLYDSQWLPQGQLNIGAEWQLTPGFALAAETGLKVQGAREYADFTNASGEEIRDRNGDANISIPLTLRGSINF